MNCWCMNPLTPNDTYESYRTANLQTLHFIYLLKNVGTEYFKHPLNSAVFFLFKMQFVL